MILDTVKLSGEDAYLRLNGEINLGTPGSGVRRSKTGAHAAIGAGTLMELSGIFFQIDGSDLLPLFQRQDDPLLSIDVVKEMYPGLMKDPYKHRVHSIGGYEDFNRSQLENLRVMEVDGYPTLVSEGNQPGKWISPVYRFSQPFTFDSAAWYLPTSKLTPKDGFSYSLTLRFWRAADPIDQPAPRSVVLAAANTLPDATRCIDAIQATAANIVAYQLEFTATVKHDTYLRERTVGDDDRQTLGRPLLRSVSLLEMTAPRYEFYSLQELLTTSAMSHIFDEHDNKLKKLTAAVAITAALEEGESVSVTVYNDNVTAAHKLTYVEARLAADVKSKPPVLNKL